MCRKEVDGKRRKRDLRELDGREQKKSETLSVETDKDEKGRRKDLEHEICVITQVFLLKRAFPFEAPFVKPYAGDS